MVSFLSLFLELWVHFENVFIVFDLIVKSTSILFANLILVSINLFPPWVDESVLQSQCTAAKTFCWNDSHSHLRWSTCPLWPHCRHYLVFSSWPVQSRLRMVLLPNILSLLFCPPDSNDWMALGGFSRIIYVEVTLPSNLVVLCS